MCVCVCVFTQGLDAQVAFDAEVKDMKANLASWNDTAPLAEDISNDSPH